MHIMIKIFEYVAQLSKAVLWIYLNNSQKQVHNSYKKSGTILIQLSLILYSIKKFLVSHSFHIHTLFSIFRTEMSYLLLHLMSLNFKLITTFCKIKIAIRIFYLKKHKKETSK